VPSNDAVNLSLQKAAEAAVGFATKAGAKEADALVESGRQFRVDVLGARVENLKQAQARGLGLRVFVDRRSALVYSSDLREGALKDLAGRAVELARKAQADEHAGLPAKAPAISTTSEALGIYDPAVAAMTPEAKIEWAKAMEKAALGVDARIKRHDGCSMQTGVGETVYASSAGPLLTYRNTSIGGFVNPLADDGDKQQSGGYGEFQTHFDRLGSAESIGLEAGRRAIEKVGARGVPTQKVPVIMHPDIAANWIQNVFNAFSGEQVFKKVSYLTEKLGQPIASGMVTLIDDGTMAHGVGSSPFDGEGLPTRQNVLVEGGVLKKFVYNAYWARKAGTESTGNAVRGYQNAPGIGNRNLYLKAGTSTPDEIFASVDRGFYLVDTGAFGYNPTTGAYSYQAAGFWIEGGKKAFPVQEITVASTTLDMLKNVVMVGNDLKFNGNVNSPTIKIAEMTISGRPGAG
jgi:PmbA protein